MQLSLSHPIPPPPAFKALPGDAGTGTLQITVLFVHQVGVLEGGRTLEGTGRSFCLLCLCPLSNGL